MFPLIQTVPCHRAYSSKGEDPNCEALKGGFGRATLGLWFVQVLGFRV